MIVEMKKVTLLCQTKDRDSTPNALRDLGVLHLEHIHEPESVDLNNAREDLKHTEAALNVLDSFEYPANTPASSKITAEALLDRIHELDKTRKELSDKLDSLNAQKSKQLLLGDFNPQTIRYLSEKNIFIRIYTISGKNPVTPPENAKLFFINDDPKNRIFALISREEINFDAKEIPIPKSSLSSIENNITTTTASIVEVHTELQKLAAYRNTVETRATELVDKNAYIEAKDGMGSAESISYLQGFCPVDLTEKISTEASTHGWGIVIEEPEPEDPVPSLIKYPAWARPIKSVFKVIELYPGYNEVDISPIFYIAFCIFFAMLVGDAGYGLLFLIATIAARLKFKKAPKEPFILLAILSSCTIVWGAITANYFGFSPELLQFLQLKWLADGTVTNELNLATLCFIIGSVHITIAHLWRMVLMINSTRAIAQFGWILLTWAMYFAARWLVLGLPRSPLCGPLFIGGLALIILFMIPIKHLKKEAMSFATFPFDVIGNFGDVVSYIRLFAVGSASLAVAMACNELALSVGIIGTVIIMLFGHTLNMILCIMGVLVHGVRLNTLEFSGHMDLSWSGFKYKPFEKTK